MSEPEAKSLTRADDPAAKLWRAYARADRPDADPEDIETLARLVRERPELLEHDTDLAAASVNTAIQRANATPAVREVLRLCVQSVKASLSYDRASAVERLLIEQVAACYLRLNIIEQGYEGVMGQEHTFKLGAYWEKKLSSAQHRYLRAIEALVRVRKLLGGPAVQFNIATRGGQQVINNAPLPKG
jgi:hypothetical protein